MNCQHCEKKLSDVYYTDYVSTCHVNEVGQKVDTGNKELYFCIMNVVVDVLNIMRKAKKIFINSQRTAENLRDV